MTRRWVLAATLAVVAAIIVTAAMIYRHPSQAPLREASQPPALGKAAIGKPAPPFQVATNAGYFDLSKETRPVFLEVFATWCPHCQRMTSVIDRLYASYGKRVAFVAVSGSDTAMDGTSDSSELDVLNWIARFKVRYPVAYDPLLNVANLYLQGGFPTLAIIGRDKKVAYLDDGEISYQELASAIQKVLR